MVFVDLREGKFDRQDAIDPSKLLHGRLWFLSKNRMPRPQLW